MRWLFAALLLAGCLQDSLVSCPDSTLCPVGLQCDTVHGGCISSDQASACVGLADGADCVAGQVHGYCLDQICVDPGCGNHIIDDGELCDDGNHNDGDGCSATCSSREVCGDGALDRRRGEECDDGNLQSHDGCDSQCRIETPVWSVDENGPSAANRLWTVYDATRGMTVMVTDGFVWGWDGSRWRVLASDVPVALGDYSVGFDSDRGTLVIVTERPFNSDIILPAPARDHIYEWDGTTWTAAVAPNAPAAFRNELSLTYDPVRHKMFAFGLGLNGIVVAELDDATKTWTIPLGPSGANHADLGFDVVFDRGRNRIVVATAGQSSPTVDAPVVFEWNGATWTRTQAAMLADAGWSLLYDPVIQRVVAIGSNNIFSTTTPVQAWNGAAWTTLAAIPSERHTNPSVAFDTSRQARVVWGGVQEAPDEIEEWTGSTWTTAPRTAPPSGVDRACAFDDARGELLCTGQSLNGSALQTWAWNHGEWTKLPDTTSSFGSTAIAYDPIRRAIVGFNVNSVAILDATGWHDVATSYNEGAGAYAVVFDPIGRRIIGSGQAIPSGFPFTLILDENNNVTTFRSPAFRALAFDARNRDVIGPQTSENTSHLVGQTWSPTVGPGFQFLPVTDARRGTVEFASPGQPLVERVGTGWIQYTDAPPVSIFGASVIDGSTGELVTVGSKGISRFMLHRRWQSATPFEDCTPGAATDLDGDGLAGCDDPDCWTTCTPACPPFVSCP